MRLGISTKVLRDFPLREAIEIAHEFGYQEMEGLRLAARLGARTATLHPGRKTAKTRKPEEAWKQQLRSIEELARCAEDCGVTLCVEAMERLGGEFVLTGADLDYIHKTLGRKELAYTLDIAHLHTVGDVCEQLELARHLPVKNIHISQSKGRGVGVSGTCHERLVGSICLTDADWTHSRHCFALGKLGRKTWMFPFFFKQSGLKLDGCQVKITNYTI